MSDFIYYLEDDSKDEGESSASEGRWAARKRARGRAVGMRRERAWTRLLNLND